ncbi:hypothetical protein EAE99_009524 [Botrytis elliptica]|nr:hypothetical protein EAE99_009524 [Botrytis elliptica]
MQILHEYCRLCHLCIRALKACKQFLCKYQANMNDTDLPGNEATALLFVDSATATNKSIPQFSTESDHSGKITDYYREGS